MNKPDLNNKQPRMLLLLGSVMAILIAISPYLFYLYEVFPKTQTWEMPFTTLKVSYFSTLYSAAWNLANKLIPLYLLFLWFLTCRHWWYHAILVPITLYAFQITSIIITDMGYFELGKMNYYYAIPTVLLFISTMAYPIRIKLLNPLMKCVDLKTLSIGKDEGQKTKRRSRKMMFAGIMTAFLISISPFIFYIYTYFPKDANTWETPFFTWRTLNYSNIYIAGWNFANKFVPFYLFLIWLLSCRHWWKYTILIPVSLYIFQLFSIVNSSIKYADEMEIYWLIPIMLAITAMVYTLRLHLFYRTIRNIDLKKIDKELKDHKAGHDQMLK